MGVGSIVRPGAQGGRAQRCPSLQTHSQSPLADSWTFQKCSRIQLRNPTFLHKPEPDLNQ